MHNAVAKVTSSKTAVEKIIWLGLMICSGNPVDYFSVDQDDDGYSGELIELDTVAICNCSLVLIGGTSGVDELWVVDETTGCWITRLRLDLIRLIPTNNSLYSIPISPLEEEICGSWISSKLLMIKFLIISDRNGTVRNVDKSVPPPDYWWITCWKDIKVLKQMAQSAAFVDVGIQGYLPIYGISCHFTAIQFIVAVNAMYCLWMQLKPNYTWCAVKQHISLYQIDSIDINKFDENTIIYKLFLFIIFENSLL